MAQMIDNIEGYRDNRKKIFEIPFNSSNKWQLSIHDLNEAKDPRYLVVMKVTPGNFSDDDDTPIFVIFETIACSIKQLYAL